MSRLTLGLSGIAVVLVVISVAAYLNRDWIAGRVPKRIVNPILGSFLGYRMERNVMIPMRDGIQLATDIYYPTRHSRPLPAVLVRTPYGKGNHGAPSREALNYLSRGYVFVSQDVRGKFRSEGEFTPYRGDSADGSDTIDWLARQPWSNGKIGTFGCSSAGEMQMLLARERNPHHAAMVASAAGGAIGTAAGRYGFGGVYEGGIFNLASSFGWFVSSGGKIPGKLLERQVDFNEAVRRLPLIGLVKNYRNDPTDFDDYVSKPLGDQYWKELGYISDDDRFATPALIINSWHDSTVADTLLLADLVGRNWDGGSFSGKQHVIIAPGTHCDFSAAAETGKVGDLPVSKAAVQPYEKWIAAWFDYWLRGESGIKPNLPPYRFYVLGEDRWIDSDNWPPRGVVFKRWYLDGKGKANTSNGSGTLHSSLVNSLDRHDELRYDPQNPVPTRGGPICCTGNSADRAGPIDQRDVESRDDVLVYTSAPLQAGLRMAGPLSAELFVSSTALDTDFVVKLVDVRPDGMALNIQEGALRMRYREGFVKPVLMQPGKIYRARVDLRAIAYYLPPGHRLRLQISSSNFPRLERNLNTGGKNFDEIVGVVALNRVYTTKDYPSAVVIPEWRDVPDGQRAGASNQSRAMK